MHIKSIVVITENNSNIKFNRIVNLRIVNRFKVIKEKDRYTSK